MELSFGARTDLPCRLAVAVNLSLGKPHLQSAKSQKQWSLGRRMSFRASELKDLLWNRTYAGGRLA